MREEEAETVEVGRIMEEIQARIAKKKASGVYTDEEIDEISRMELSLQEREGYGEEMDRLLSWLHANWEATGPVDREVTAADRPLREAAKKFLNALLGPEARLLLAKQNQINARTVQLLSGVLPPLREGFRDAEERLDSLALRLEEENRQLREKVDGLASRLERLEGRPGPSPGERQGQ